MISSSPHRASSAVSAGLAIAPWIAAATPVRMRLCRCTSPRTPLARTARRDLRVSPGHSLCVDVVGEVLIPAIALVNGTTIVQEDVDCVTYWHVELEGGHDIVLAENMPAESYLEMGNRGFFAESGVVALNASPDTPVATHADFCRPFHMEGALVEVVRAQLAARAKTLGWRKHVLTKRPQLRVFEVASPTEILAQKHKPQLNRSRGLPPTSSRLTSGSRRKAGIGPLRTSARSAVRQFTPPPTGDLGRKQI